jgi:Fe-S cluster assembly protein SufD
MPTVRSLAESARALGGLPSTEEEVWRYSRVDELDLDDYHLATGAASTDVPTHLTAAFAALPDRAATVSIVNGRVAAIDVVDPAVTITVETATEPIGEPTDLFFRLNDDVADERLVISVRRGATVLRPIAIAHWQDQPGLATFPRTIVRVGESAQANVIEYYASASEHSGLTVPVVELDVAPAANLGYVGAQNLGLATWQVGSQVSTVGQEATLTSALAGFGGDYARQRTDCRLVGRGATGNLLAVYFGEEDQTLDFRTFQDHAAPDTTSNLLFKGAVGGRSRSVYTGLIRVRKEARGTNAFQTNRNIKLSEHAWAESVPNLEIENNDVKCSHASAVGPVDEEQRFYLESRGVPTPIAERLVVTGFFDEVLTQLPVPLAGVALRSLVAGKLDRQVGVS